MRRASGNLGAMELLRLLWFFRRTGASGKKMLAVPPGRRRIWLFANRGSLKAIRPLYLKRQIHLQLE
jgi:hypothetical protein